MVARDQVDAAGEAGEAAPEVLGRDSVDDISQVEHEPVPGHPFPPAPDHQLSVVFGAVVVADDVVVPEVGVTQDPYPVEVLLDHGGVGARKPVGPIGYRAHGAGSPARARWAGPR